MDVNTWEWPAILGPRAQDLHFVVVAVSFLKASLISDNSLDSLLHLSIVQEDLLGGYIRMPFEIGGDSQRWHRGILQSCLWQVSACLI